MAGLRSGLFESDPWEDLTGNEVAIKLLVLGREIGIPLLHTHVDVEPFVVVRTFTSSIAAS
jgi:homoserine dehydrogenase